MLIAIDFDDTITADVSFWSEFIKSSLRSNHEIIVVTARDDTESNLSEIRRCISVSSIPVIMTSGKPKREAAENELFAVDIWIDDYPESIVGEKTILESAYDEIDRLNDVAIEARESRDKAKSEAMEAVQAEMAELRRELARYKSMLPGGVVTVNGKRR